jgi:hypothetical protein
VAQENINAISFTHKWKTGIAEAYAAQPIVIFYGSRGFRC